MERLIFYPEQLLLDERTRGIRPVSLGILLRMIAQMAASPGEMAITSDHQRLANMTGVSLKMFDECWDHVSDWFVLHESAVDSGDWFYVLGKQGLPSWLGWDHRAEA